MSEPYVRPPTPVPTRERLLEWMEPRAGPGCRVLVNPTLVDMCARCRTRRGRRRRQA